MKVIRKYIHGIILWYIENMCGGDFHTRSYGPSGRYVVLMNEDQYNRYTNYARDNN